MPSLRKICRKRESFTGIKLISRARSLSRKGSSRPGTRPPRVQQKRLSCRRRKRSKRRKWRKLMRKTCEGTKPVAAKAPKRLEGEEA